MCDFCTRDSPGMILWMVKCFTLSFPTSIRSISTDRAELRAWMMLKYLTGRRILLSGKASSCGIDVSVMISGHSLQTSRRSALETHYS